MENSIKISGILLISFLSIILSSCGGGGDEPEPKPNPNPDTPKPESSIVISGDAANGLNFDADGGVQQVSFTASGYWTVTVAKTGGTPWCNVTPQGGDEKSASVKVKVDANTGYDQRSVTLTFACGTAKKSIVVTQKQTNALLLSSDKLEVGQAGGDYIVEVRSNVSYSVEIPEQFASWISKTGSRGLTTSNVNLRIAPNESDESRTGYVEFSGEGLRERLNVYQSSGSLMILSPKEVCVPYTGETFKVELRSNCEYEIEMPDADWIKRDMSRAMSSHTLYFIVDPFDGLEDRKAEVSFKATDGSATENLTVVQRPKGALIISGKEVKLSNAGGSFSIRYSANTEISYAILDQGDSWISGVRSRGLVESELWFTAAKNESEEKRSARIALYDSADRSVSDTVVVEQEGSYLTYTTSLKQDDFMDAASHRFTIDVDANIPYEVSIPDYIVRLEEGSGSVGRMVFEIQENGEEGVSRMGYIYITGNGKTYASIPVSQAMMKVELKNKTYLVKDYNASRVIPDITSNINVRAVIPDEAASWINVTYDDDVKYVPCFDIAPNPGYDERQAVITLRAGEKWSTAIIIRQQGRPNDSEPVEVAIPAGGSLTDILTEEKAMTIQNLSVKGDISSTDIFLIRRMSMEGSLTDLDLTESVIRSNDEGYEVYPYGTQYIEEDNTVGRYMFYKVSLNHLKLPRTLKRIDRQAFNYSSIVDVEIPYGVEEIGEFAFNGCQRMVNITIPGSVKKIPYSCFTNTTSLDRVVLDEGVEELGEIAFFHYPAGGDRNNSMLREVVLPSTLKKIENSAFGFSGIRSIVIPENVTEYGKEIFLHCHSLTKVVMKGVPSDGVLPEEMFFECNSLSDITLPKGIRVIGRAAFCYVTAPEITLHEGLEEIGDYAFNQTDIMRLNLPEGLKVIGEGAFSQMWKMKSLILPSTVTTVGGNLLSCTVNTLEALHCRMPAPPETAGPLVADDFDYSKCTLYVPKGSKSLYEAAPYWQKFIKIVEE